jgi:hypothetical protein
MIGRFFFVSLFMVLCYTNTLGAEPVKPVVAGTPNATVQATSVIAPSAQPVAATVAKQLKRLQRLPPTR